MGAGNRLTKTHLTAICLLLFIASINSYLYCMAKYPCNINYMNVWYTTSISFLTITTFLFLKTGTESFLQDSLINGGIILLCLLWIDVILTRLHFIQHPYYNLFIFLLGSGFAIFVLLFELLKDFSILKWIVLIICALLFCYLLVVVASHSILSQR